MNIVTRTAYPVSPEDFKEWKKLLYEAHAAERKCNRKFAGSMAIWTALATGIWLTGWNERIVMLMAIVLGTIYSVVAYFVRNWRRGHQLFAAIEELQPPQMRGRNVGVDEVYVEGVKPLSSRVQTYKLTITNYPYEHNKGVSRIEKSPPPLR